MSQLSLLEVGGDAGQREASDRDRAEGDENPHQERRLDHKKQNPARNQGKVKATSANTILTRRNCSIPIHCLYHNRRAP